MLVQSTKNKKWISVLTFIYHRQKKIKNYAFSASTGNKEKRNIPSTYSFRWSLWRFVCSPDVISIKCYEFFSRLWGLHIIRITVMSPLAFILPQLFWPSKGENDVRNLIYNKTNDKETSSLKS